MRLLPLFFCLLLQLVSARHSLASPEEELLFLEAMNLVKKGEYIIAREQLVLLTESSPRNSLFWFNLGNVQFIQNDYKLAKKSYRRVIFLKGSLAPVARYYTARVQEKIGYIDRAAVQLSHIPDVGLPPRIQNLVREKKIEIQEKLLLRAQKAFALKKYRIADRFVRQALLLGPKQEVLALQGLVELKQGRQVSAYRAFSRASQIKGSQNSNLRLLVQKIGERLDSEKKSLFVQGEVAVGWNTNIDAEGVGDAPEENRSLLAQIYVDKYLFEKKNFESDLRVYLGAEEFLLRRDNPFDQQAAGGTVTASFESVNRWWHEGANYIVTPKLVESVSSGTLYWERFGLALMYERKVGLNSYQMEYKVSKLTPKNDGASYLAGTEQVVTIGWAKYWKNSSVTAAWELRRHGAEDVPIGLGVLPRAYDSNGPAIAALWNSPSRMWRLDTTLYLSLRDYDYPEQPSGVRRRDVYSSFFARLGYWWEYGWGKPNLYVQMEHIDNKSTLGAGFIENRTYKQRVYHVGLVWDWDS